MRTRVLLGLSVLTLVACGNRATLPIHDTTLQDKLRNPLYAEFYFDDLTEQMLTLALQEDPILQEPGVRATVDRVRTRSLQRAAVALAAQEKGRKGPFLSDRDIVFGDALLLENTLYFGPTFDAAAGPSLQVYLTNAIDPREGEFPDDTAVHLGPIKDNYGAQAFAVPVQPASASGTPLRTAVIWDDELDLLYGFAQLAWVQPQE